MWKRAVSSTWLGALLFRPHHGHLLFFCPILSQVLQAGPPGCVPPVMEIINIHDASANREVLWSACVYLSFI